jgi:hypothetical protein
MQNPRCIEGAPEDLKDAVLSPHSLLKWCRPKTTEELREALGFIHRDFVDLRDVINEEIDRRQHRETQAHLESLKVPNWTVLPTFGLVIIAILVSVLSWVFPRR